VEGLEIVGFLAVGALLVVIVLQLGPLLALAVGALSLGGVVGSWWMFVANGTIVVELAASPPTLLYLALVFFRPHHRPGQKADPPRLRIMAPALLTESRRTATG
jgi:adenylate cyclase